MVDKTGYQTVAPARISAGGFYYLFAGIFIVFGILVRSGFDATGEAIFAFLAGAFFMAGGFFITLGVLHFFFRAIEARLIDIQNALVRGQGITGNMGNGPTDGSQGSPLAPK